MNNKTAYKYTCFVVWITLTAIAALFLPWRRSEPECYASPAQTVVRWKDLYYNWCRYSWEGHCLWPISRPHSTYKVTVHEGIPLLDEHGLPVVMAGGKIRSWGVYDAATWNAFATRPPKWQRFPDYEPIAENEYVIIVRTRYRLFHNVEANLRICTQHL
jgi:hypothetical protein